MKHLLTRSAAFALILAALIGMIPFPAFAAESTAVSGTCGENAVWVLEGNTLTISGTGAVTNTPAEQDNWDAYADQVEYVIVEEGITVLDDCVFLEHENLLSIELPDSLEVIGTQVFQDCNKITQFTIPKNVRQIAGGDWEEEAASGTFSCSSLGNIFVDPENERYYDEDGVLFDRSTNALLVYPYGRTDASYQVPEGVERIGYGAFWLTCLDEVFLPESVTVIEGSAFYASDISRMEFPKNLTRIGSMAFQNCKSLTEVTLYENLERIEEYAFAFCDSLEDVAILSRECLIYARNDSFPKSTVLHGYSGSTTENHAKRFGYDFVDVEAGEVRNYNVGNTGFMAQLPTNLAVSAPAYNCVHSSDENGNIVQYQPTMALERDTSNETYQEILAKVEELTSGCSDELEKARCIQQWVTENMTYRYWGGDGSIENVYIYWRDRTGNCMAYTQLTNFMLYLAGFPVAALSGEGHYDSALTSVVIPDGVTTIGDDAFAYTELKSVYISASVTSIGVDAFRYAPVEETHVAEGNQVYSSVDGVLYTADGTTLLEYPLSKPDSILVIPDGVTTIDDDAVDSISELREVVFPASIREIGFESFSWCSYLSKITFLGDAPVIGEEAFYAVHSGVVYYPADNETWTENKRTGYGGNLVWVPYTGETAPAEVVASGVCGDALTWTLDAAGTLMISGEGTMYDYTADTLEDRWQGYAQQIKTVIFRDGVLSVGDYALFNCDGLSQVFFSSRVETIGKSAFEDCGSITTLELPYMLTSIGSSAFYLCNSLTDVTLNSNLTSIGSAAFAYCGELTGISIPETVTSIGPDVFEGCNKLSYANIPEGITSVGRRMFAYCDSLTSIVIPDSVTELGAFAFYDCDNLADVTVGSGLSTIGKSAFQNCLALTTIELPEGLVSIGETAFCGAGLTEISIPKTVTAIGNNAFETCAALHSITFQGDAPTFVGYESSGVSHAFYDVTATACYPAGNETWTEDVLLDYGGTITWVAYGGFDIGFASMTMGNSLAINFAFDKSEMDDWTSCYAEIVKTYADGRENVVVTVPDTEWKSATIGGVAHYYVTFNGIAAKEMADEVYVTIYNAEGVAVSNTKTDSVRAQSMRIIDTVSDLEKTMIVDMLNYGAAAQSYFGYATDDLANGLLSETQAACASTPQTCADIRSSTNSCYVASNVNLESSIQLMLAFRNVDSTMKAVVTYTDHYGSEKTIEVAGTDFAVDGNFSIVTVDSLVVADGRQAVTCTVYNADGTEVVTITDSLESYTARKNGTGDLFTKMMQYSDSAYAYFRS